jgi:chromosome segregation ATPase
MGLFNSKELEELKKENEELKTQIQRIYEKEESANNLEKVLKKMRAEITQLIERKNNIIREIDSLAIQEQQKREQMIELDQKIVSLKEMKDQLQNTILSYTTQAQDMELTIREQNAKIEFPNSESPGNSNAENYIDDMKQKIAALNQEEAGILTSYNQTKQEIDNIAEQKQDLLESQQQIDKKVEKAEQKITSLEEKQTNISNEIELKKKELFEYTEKLSAVVKEYTKAKESVSTLQEKESKLAKRIGELTEEEMSRSEFARELRQFDKELSEKHKLLDEAEQNYRKVSEEASFKEKEIYAINQTLSIKANRLSKINLDLLNMEKKYGELKNEIKRYEILKTELHQKFTEEKLAADRFTEQAAKLREIVPLLEKRKKEIEQSNAQLEIRFTEMFQKFNKELSEVTKKRNILEQIILKKEKDIDERDIVLFEKISALEESEKFLNTRQAEIESFEKQIILLRDQKEGLQTDLQKIDEDATGRKNYNDDMRLEMELLMKKRGSMEKGIQELLRLTSDSFSKAGARKLKLDDELREYEEKILVYREKINDSMRELSQLQVSIGSIKVEHEEHKGTISKLVSMKKRLHEEILKQQAALQKFQKVREKLKIEQAVSKNSQPAQTAGPYSSDKSAPAKNNVETGQKNAQIYKL